MYISLQVNSFFEIFFLPAFQPDSGCRAPRPETSVTTNQTLASSRSLSWKIDVNASFNSRVTSFFQ